MGELHLDIIVDRLMREFKVQANVGSRVLLIASRLPARSIKSTIQVRQAVWWSRSVWSCCFSMEPGERGSGVIFENKIVGGSIPKEYIPAIEKGVREATESGVIAGYPVVDLKVTLLMAHIMKLTRTKWLSRWLLQWPLKKAFKVAVVFCLSRS
jgi:elongation factor G